MPTCLNCGEQDFDLVDGLYYCIQCQTQTQEIQEEEQADAFGSVSYNLQIRQKKDVTTVEKRERDKGRPWLLHEGFGVLLREQVQALIRLGANPKLEDVALRIWVLYLSKLQLAFYKEEEGTKDDSDNTRTAIEIIKQRGRDKYQGTVADPKPKSYMRAVAKYKKCHGTTLRSKKTMKHAQEQEEFAATMQDHEFYEGDNPAEEQGVQNATDRDLLRLAEVELEEKGQGAVSESTIKRSSYWLNKTWILSACYLALQYTDNLMMPADLIRLVENEQVPFNQAESIFPDDMKFTYSDQQIFSDQKKCSADVLRVKTGHLAKFLDLAGFKEPPVDIIANRYIAELNLPDEMHGLVHELIQLAPPADVLQNCPAFRGELPNYAALAMAYIIVMLKLLFGLDDITERELTAYAKKLEQDIAEPLFILEDWMAAAHQKQQTAKSTCAESVKGTKRQSTSATFGVRQTSRYFDKAKKRSSRADVREALARPFSVLLSKVTADVSASQSAAGGDISDNLVTGDAGTHGNDPTSHSSEAGIKARDFSRCTLRYITEEEDFVEKVLVAEQNIWTLDGQIDQVYDDGVGGGQDSDSSGDEGIFPVPARFRCPTNHHKPHYSATNEAATAIAKSPRTREMVKKVLDRCLKTNECFMGQEDALANMSRVLPRAHQRYLMYAPQYSLGPGRHRSYLWLVELCASHIGASTGTLEYIRLRLELILFPQACAATKKRDRTSSQPGQTRGSLADLGW